MRDEPGHHNRMKNIGLIGGMSWESSAHYYRIVNERARSSLGGLHSARSLMLSVDFGDIAPLQAEGGWLEAGEILADAARSLERGGADFIVLCTNTMHKVTEAIARSISIPILHIADATASAIETSASEESVCWGLALPWRKISTSGD